MSIALSAWLIVSYVLILFGGALVSGAFGSGADETLSRFLAFDVLRLQPIPWIPIKIPTLSFEWLDSLRKILMWELSAFDSAGGRWLRYLVLLPLSSAVALGVGLNVGPRLMSAAAALIAAVPRPILYGAIATQLVASALQAAGI